MRSWNYEVIYGRGSSFLEQVPRDGNATGMEQHWDSTWGHRPEVGTWLLGIPCWERLSPLWTPLSHSFARGTFVFCDIYLPDEPFWRAAPVPFSPQIPKWSREFWENTTPKIHTHKHLWRYSLSLCCARTACGGGRIFGGFFAIIDYFLAWGLEGAPMQPSQSFPGKSLLPGLVHGAAEDRREEASSMYFWLCDHWRWDIWIYRCIYMPGCPIVNAVCIFYHNYQKGCL